MAPQKPRLSSSSVDPASSSASAIPHSSAQIPAGQSQSQSQAPYTPFRNPLRLSFRRPDTASTTSSFISASPDLTHFATNSNKTPSTTAADNTAGPHASSSVASPPSRPTSPVSPSHSQSGRISTSRIGRSFEAILASDETYVLTETAGVARDSNNPAHASLERGDSLTSLGSGGKRVVLQRPPKWEEESEDLAEDLASVDHPVHIQEEDEPVEDMLRTPTEQSSTRMPSRSHRIAERITAVSEEHTTPRSDPSNDNSSKNANRRSWLRQGGTSSSPDLKSLSSKRFQEGLPPLPATDWHGSPSSRVMNEPTSVVADTRPSSAGRRPDTSSSFHLSTSSLSSKGESAQSISSQIASSRARERAHTTSDRYKNGTNSLHAAGPYYQPQESESLSLAQEVTLSNNEPETESLSMAGTFRERMKKTSGFLRKLRGDSNSQDKKAKGRSSRSGGRGQPFTGHAAETGSVKTVQHPKTLSRRESQASVTSEGTHSIANSVYSNSSGPTLRSGAPFVSAENVPVPAIPPQFAKATTATSSKAPLPTNGDGEPASFNSSALPGPVTSLGPPPGARSTSRAPSAPIESSQTATVVLPQRSSSARHERALAGSDGSGGEMKLVIKDWEIEMDHALRETALDLDKKTEFNPRPVWGPSPKLPDLNLQRYKERSGSFMDEGESGAIPEYPGSGSVMPSADGKESLPTTPITASTVSSKYERGLSPYEAEQNRRKGEPHFTVDALPNRNQAGLGIGNLRQEPTSHALLRSNTNLSAQSEPAVSTSRLDSSAQRRKSYITVHTPSNGAGSPNLGGSTPLSGGASSPTRAERCESPGGSIRTPRSSRRNSTDSIRQTPPTHVTHSRGAYSGASMTSVRSFETAAESTGLNSADAGKTAFFESLNDRSASPALPTGLEAPGSPVELRTSLPVSAPSPDRRSASADASTAPAPQNEESLLGLKGSEEAKAEAEQSIRLITKPTGTGHPNYDEPPTPTDATTITELLDEEQSNKAAAASVSDRPKAGLDTISEASRSTLASMSQAASESDSTAFRQAIGTTGSQNGTSGTWKTSSAAKPSFDVASLVEEDLSRPSMALNAEARGIELAAKCWAEDPTFLRKEKIAEWLGGIGTANKAARNAYFANFDFSGLRVDMAFRKLCEKLFLKAETQQIDRILSAFSQRYQECNPDHVFGTADNIHSVVFSLLLLNTDLHVADIQDRMTRTQFIRNTMAAVSEHSDDRNPSSFPADDSRSSFSVAIDPAPPMSGDNLSVTSGTFGNGSSGSKSRLQRAESIRSQGSPATGSHDVPGYAASEAPSSPRPSLATLSIGPSGVGSLHKSEDMEREAILRDIYNAVKNERILLPTPEAGAKVPSTVARRRLGVGGSDRVSALKRGSIRGIQGLLGGGSFGSDPSVSPTPSSAGSRSNTDPWGKSVSSLASNASVTSSQTGTATLGFASTLTQTIIREAQDEDAQSSSSALDELDDDELALMGPPWAKEGSLTRKHYWEATGKRSKDKNWTEVFVVVQRGVLSMFKFGDSSSGGGSKASKSTVPSMSSAAVGGGNWLSNATPLGEVNLAHTLANALPPPGYNRTRPHVFALTLPGGAVYFFQAGHEDLVHEWVQTCNYWAARQSKEPLPGGVSNMEYGWNKVLPSEEYEELSSDVESPATPAREDVRSIRSGRSLSILGGAPAHANERMHINDWKPPAMPTVSSNLREDDQLDRAQRHMAHIEAELTVHNELRQPMLALYSPRGSNHARALSNWERKSNHLLQELVKYQCYVESLRNSAKLRADKRGMKEVDSMIRRADEVMDHM